MTQNTKKYTENKKQGVNTRLAHAGNQPRQFHGFVNPPVVRASTVLFPDYKTMKNKTQKYTYGTHGTPTTDALEEVINELENAEGTVLVPSGLAAISIPVITFAQANTHMLVVDGLYTPNRRFCDTILKNLGVEVEYFSPNVGKKFESLMRPNTKIVMLECPASNSFEMCDVPLITQIAHKKNKQCVVMMDNTWATPLLFKPLNHGVDISINALTKYPGGHSDVLMGSVSANKKVWKQLKGGHTNMGICVGGDDAYLVLRGMRTMGIRIERQQKSAMVICQWLNKHPKVDKVLYPALQSDPGYKLWKRDFGGATGLFSFVIKNGTEKHGEKFLNALKLHGLGYSWAGYESLAVMPDFSDRTIAHKPKGGVVIRIQVGLEDTEDIINDLKLGFNAIQNVK